MRSEGVVTSCPGYRSAGLCLMASCESAHLANQAGRYAPWSPIMSEDFCIATDLLEHHCILATAQVACADVLQICSDGVCQMACKEWSQSQCNSALIPKAHLAALQTCPVSADNCTLSEPGEGVAAVTLA